MPSSSNSTLSELFTTINIVKVVGTFFIATCVVWLNSNYVKQNEFKELTNRIVVVESKTNNLERQMGDIVPVLKNIEKRLSNIITEDGKIIYDNKIINMERDIGLIQKDIEYIKDNISKK
jgi:hypothetical protein